MLPVSDLALNSTVRIECADGSSGTGFFCEILKAEKIAVPIIVTNKHVIEGITNASIRLTLKRPDGLPSYGNFERVELEKMQGLWIHHPNPNVDLAIMFLEPILAKLRAKGADPFYIPVQKQFALMKEDSQNLFAIEDIVIVGYPSGLWDAANNVPLIRRGITATPYFLDHNGRSEFVIDAPCFPGSSGSPVFIVNQGSYSSRTALLNVGNRFLFLGVLFAVPLTGGTSEIFRIPAEKRPATSDRPIMNLGYCIKAERVFDFEPYLISQGFQMSPG